MSDRVDAAIREQHEIVDSMVFANGAVFASPWGPYKAHWLRDGLYTLEAYKHHGIHKRLLQLLNAPMNIFHRYNPKIRAGVRQKPDAEHEFIHSRYDAYTLREIPGPWGHRQFDTLGLFLYEIADLVLKYPALLHSLDIEHDGSTIVVNNLTRYLNTSKWWELPDYGCWEEGPDLHSSSIGAVVGGLQKLEELNGKSESGELFFELEQLKKGRRALKKLLPRETDNPDGGPNRHRDCDMAQLSLIWPFDVLDDAQTDTVLERIEKNLVRDKGVIRYAHDPYYNAADDRFGYGELENGEKAVFYHEEHAAHLFAVQAGSEAEWPLGFAWLSIVHSHLADKRDGDRGQDHRARARDYWERLLANTVKVEFFNDTATTEIYTGGFPNLNTPLTWSSAFTMIASVKLASHR
jgi:phosphorylase kinase alpha/beta subunit